MASETMALAESADTGHFVALMTKEIFGLKIETRVSCKTDTKSLEKELKGNTRTYAQSGYYKLRVMVKLGKIEVQ